MHKYFLLKIIILPLMLSMFLFAQPSRIKFKKYTVKDGLSQSFTTSILQDKKGFMWFGTQDGLNRFDGYNFKVYKHIPGDESSLSENWIWDIYEDKHGYLWCGTFGGGASRFDRGSETFKSFRHESADKNSISDNTIWNFYECSNGILWIAANNGLNVFNHKTEQFNFYPPLGREINVFEIFPLDDKFLIFKTAAGLMKFAIDTKEFTLLPIEPEKSNYTAQDNLGNFWIQNESGKISPITFQIDFPETILNTSNNSSVNIGYKSLIQTALDKHGFLWCTTKTGLSILKFSADELVSLNNYNHDKNDPQSISSNDLSKIYSSRGGEIWISARNALNKFDYNSEKFKHFYNSPDNSSSLSHNGVLPIFASRLNEGIVWIGTRSGLNRFDERTGVFTKYFHDPENPENSLCGNYILSLYEDSKGNLWVGTRGDGLSNISFYKNTGAKFKNFKHDPLDVSSISSNSIHSIYQDRNGRLWFGTGGGGLNLFNEEKKTFTKFTADENDSMGISGNWVYNIVEDSSGKFWIGTAANGLNLFDPQTKTFKHFLHDPKNVNSISSNRVLSALETSAGNIWIGTALGLNKVIKPKNEKDDYSFIKYYEKDGLPNDVIYGILEDDSADLWISTNNGLCKLTMKEGNAEFRSYYIEDGLQSDEFDQNSFSKASDGKMYFGGIGGFNVFHPNEIKDNSFIPPIVITDFKIMNESVPIALHRNDKNKISTGNAFHLKKSISETDTITLTHRDDVISFEFTALNFTVSERNQYAYMMEGFDAGWIYSGSRRFVTYTNLDPGEYNFRVKGSNNDGVWNEAGASIFIIVAPPPWATWWAYTIYILLILYGIFFLIRKRERALKHELEVQLKIDQAKTEERENVRKKTSQDFHDEAGNKLTKIRLFTTLAKRENPDLNLKKYLTQIEENTTELSNGMRDFLWVLDAGKDTLFDMIKRLEEFGNSMFEFSNTNYKVIGEKEEFKKIILPMETRRTLILIFKEAMNNCLKYSEANNVILNVELNNNILNLSLSDDGLGFNSGKISQGYGLKNMNARAESIKGKLEILSEIKGGTKIIFKGNITHMGS